MRMVIRSDASGTIGMGHISRCLTLTHEARMRGADCMFVTARLDGRGADAVSGAGFPVQQLDVKPGSMNDAASSADAVREFGAGVILTDGYSFKEKYLRRLKATGVPLVCIDDIAHTFFPCDMLVNQNIAASASIYKGRVDANARMLLGTRFALVRQEFVEARGNKGRTRRQVKNVLVTFGGSSLGLSACIKALRALELSGGVFHAVAVLGTEDRALTGKVEAALAGMSLRVDLLGYADNMANLMRDADIAITGGGSTCWEVACVGVPSVVIAIADNQSANIRGLGSAGVSIDLGWHGDVRPEDIAYALEKLSADIELRASMRKRGRALVDGKGAARVVTEIERLDADRA